MRCRTCWRAVRTRTRTCGSVQCTAWASWLPCTRRPSGQTCPPPSCTSWASSPRRTLGAHYPPNVQAHTFVRPFLFSRRYAVAATVLIIRQHVRDSVTQPIICSRLICPSEVSCGMRSAVYLRKRKRQYDRLDLLCVHFGGCQGRG